MSIINVLDLILFILIQISMIAALNAHPGYELLIVGYSLGGGVASLIAEELLFKQRKPTFQHHPNVFPKHVMIRCITYGAPPTYSCPNNYKNPHIFSIKNHHDVISKIYIQDTYKIYM